MAEFSPDEIGNACRFGIDTTWLARWLDKPPDAFRGGRQTPSKARWC